MLVCIEVDFKSVTAAGNNHCAARQRQAFSGRMACRDQAVSQKSLFGPALYFAFIKKPLILHFIDHCVHPCKIF